MKKYLKRSFVFSLILLLSELAFGQQKVTFPSLDSLLITADLYTLDTDAPMIILCHQAGYSRGEYIYTAKKLNQLGFNCLAIDQRSGGEVNKIKNETSALALKNKKPVSFLDAEQDIVAAVNYLFSQNKHRVVLLGSSYSASLVLKIAKENEQVAAALSFSPGEYFPGKLSVAQTISGLSKPVFITCTKKERPEVTKIAEQINSSNLSVYFPDDGGVHGSRALWPESPDSRYEWVQVEKFLLKIKRKIN